MYLWFPSPSFVVTIYLPPEFSRCFIGICGFHIVCPPSIKRSLHDTFPISWIFSSLFLLDQMVWHVDSIFSSSPILVAFSLLLMILACPIFTLFIPSLIHITNSAVYIFLSINLCPISIISFPLFIILSWISTFGPSCHRLASYDIIHLSYNCYWLIFILFYPNFIFILSFLSANVFSHLKNSVHMLNISLLTVLQVTNKKSNSTINEIFNIRQTKYLL